MDVLSVEEGPDAHPERRRKALYNAYLERELPRWKEEHPGKASLYASLYLRIDTHPVGKKLFPYTMLAKTIIMWKIYSA